MNEMKGTVILSHGLESGPDATKTAAMAEVAERLGWKTVRMDFRDIGSTLDEASILRRVGRLRDAAVAVDGPLVLAGSSMGAFSSALVSVSRSCAGLFLLAPPTHLGAFPEKLACGAQKTEIVHGWHDELIPAADVVAFAQPNGYTLHLVNDTHRLAGHVERIAAWFGDFLERLA
jgi:predicted alpha/beta-hydrolase family hydrolase